MFRALIVFVVVLFLTQVSTNVIKDEITGYNDTNTILKSFYPANVLKRYTDEPNSTNTTKCFKQVQLLINQPSWALKMFDASSKIPSGILTGNMIDLGMYDECISTVITESDDEIRGRHCMYDVQGSFTEPEICIKLSICVPASCEPEDVKAILNIALEFVSDKISVTSGIPEIQLPITFGKVTCSAIDTPEWTAGGILTVIGLSLLLLFLIVCTICDCFLKLSIHKYTSNSRLAMLRQFSIYTSALRIFSTKTTPQTLPALQGIRFFSMCWVILGHEYLMFIAGPTVNVLQMGQWIHSWSSVYILIAPFAVDTFFCVSGFLMGYLFLKEMSGGRSFNLPLYYMHRYLRLTPAFGAVLLMTIFIFPRLGSSLFWESRMGLEETSCRNNWWSMLLYVHNYVNMDKAQCLGHTWYLAVEMQFFWISPLILYPLARKPKIGLVILGALFIFSVIIPGKISYDLKMSAFLFGDDFNTGDKIRKYYMASHNRASAWLIGIMYGAAFFWNKGSTSKMMKYVGWSLTFVAYCFCIFSIKIFQAKDYKYNVPWETFYATASKPTWAAAVGWMIYASVRGFGGPITSFLSFSIFHPFSRISYSVYLVHYIIQRMKVSATRTPRYFTDFNAFDMFLSDLVLSIIVGFMFSLAFESPVLTLEKLVKQGSRQKIINLNKALKDEKVENGISEPQPILINRPQIQN